jgi:hypothetical protein
MYRVLFLRRPCLNARLPFNRFHRQPTYRFYSQQVTTEKETFRSITRKYGVVAVGVYLSISFTVFCSILGSMTFMNISPHDIQSFLYRIKSSIPFLHSSQDLDKEEEQVRQEAEQAQHEGILGWIHSQLESSNPEMVQFMTNAVLAMAVAKLFSPIKLAITVLVLDLVGNNILLINEFLYEAIKFHGIFSVECMPLSFKNMQLGI